MYQAEVLFVLRCNVFQEFVQLDGEDREHWFYFAKVMLQYIMSQYLNWRKLKTD